MSFIQKALKVLQEFPNLKNEPFQVKDKKKKSFLQEAENFFRNLTSSPNQQNDIETETDSIQIDLDQISDDSAELTKEENFFQEQEISPELVSKFSSDEDNIVSAPIVPVDYDDEDELIVDLDLEENEVTQELPENDQVVEVSSLENFEEIKSDTIDEFSGDTETVDLSLDIAENETSPNSDDSTVLEDWEKDAMAESLSDPFLEEDDKAEEILDELEEKNSDVEPTDAIDPIVDINVEEAFETAKQFKSGYEEKLENYLVLFEITKELLKSKSFDDFFENLMYSIIGQVGPEIMIIFSSRDGNFSQMKIVAHEGIDIEPDYVIKKGDTLYSLLESEQNVVFAKDLLEKDLKPRERVLLENPLTEILIPIRVMDQFSGFIVAGKMISGEIGRAHV